MIVAGRAIDANSDKSTDRKTHRNRAILRTDAGGAFVIIGNGPRRRAPDRHDDTRLTVASPARLRVIARLMPSR
jgi:hypothetical protein